MSARIDLTGQRFGKLVAVRIVGSSRYGSVWECQCDCGGTSRVVAARLRYKRGERSCLTCTQQEAAKRMRPKAMRVNRARALARQFERSGSLYWPNEEGEP